MSSKTMNKVFLMGHLGHTPELQVSKAGKPYTRLNLATHRWVPGEEVGSGKEATDWHSIFVWGPLAERCVDHLRRGALVFVEGALSYWKVGDSSPQYKNAVHAHNVRFLNFPQTTEVPPEVEEPMETVPGVENLDNLEEARNHNAVAHL